MRAEHRAGLPAPPELPRALRLALLQRIGLIWTAFRVIGKRELTRISPGELVSLLFMPQLFSRARKRQDYSLTNAIVGASTLRAGLTRVEQVQWAVLQAEGNIAIVPRG